MSDGQGPSKRVRFGDPGFEEQLNAWYNEICEEDENSDKEEVDENYYQHSDYEESESETDESETNSSRIENIQIEESAEVTKEANNYVKSYYGKNRYKWSSNSFSSTSRTPAHNLVLKLPGLKPSAEINEADFVTSWQLLFSQDILDVILVWTNRKICSMKEKYKNQNRAELQELDINELKAFIGLLFYTAIFHSNHEHLNRMYATVGTGREIFRCVMSKNRFAVLLIALRFDNPEDRNIRKQNDPLAPISEIFQKFTENCQRVYSPGVNMCIDEMLISFRGKCKYKMYMPQKPCKYGIKILCMTDARTNYFYNGYVYSGKDSDGVGLSNEEKKLSKPCQSVIRLSQPVQNTNRNITADNWFSSIELVEELRGRGLTYVGTVRKNKKEIPIQFLANRNRVVGTTLFGFTKYLTLLPYVPKKNRAVLLLSSMHHTNSIDEETNKPEVIMFYNSTKGGVDALDEKCAIHSSSRRTQRWPMAIFFRLVDISGVNAHILHQVNKNNTILEKTDFLKNLADQLVKPQLERRVNNIRLKRNRTATRTRRKIR